MRYLIDLLLVIGAVGLLQAVAHVRWRSRLRRARWLEREAGRRLREVRLSEMALTAMVSPLEAPKRVYHN